MKHAFIENYSLAVELPDDYSIGGKEGIPYEPDWDGLICGEEECRKLRERLKSLRESGIMPIVAVFVPREER